MTYDVVIVGAGSAGCVLANRLSARPDLRVLLLEAGPADRNPWLKIPAGISRVFVHPTLNWGYRTEPEPHLGGRRIYWPRGKTLGGSSAINGMAYVRGHPSDYDGWRQLGATGWSWDEVLPYFKRSERNARFGGISHGVDGELTVSDPRIHHPAAVAFVEAARAAGVPEIDDFNDGRQLGAGFLQFTIRDGVRASTAAAFLHPILRRPNLRVETEALAERVLFEGRRAVGVVYRQGGRSHQVHAREVILAAGAINSPHLLMLSGVGPGEHLRETGVEVTADLPGVGENLHDHLYVHLRARVSREFSINHRIRGWALLPELVDYALRRRGLLTLGASQACAFVRSGEHVDNPDLQINFRPMSTAFTPAGRLVSDPVPGVTASVCHLRPQSRGRIRLASPDPAAAPLMTANYLAEVADREAMLAGVRWIRRIFAQSPLARHVAAEIEPGGAVASSHDLLAFVRDQAQSMYHPVGSCRMGADALAVTDSSLRVRGLEGLRVADASVMPQITSGNTNAPAIMIAEKAADLLAADLAGGGA